MLSNSAHCLINEITGKWKFPPQAPKSHLPIIGVVSMGRRITRAKATTKNFKTLHFARLVDLTAKPSKRGKNQPFCAAEALQISRG
jgi:hypothetical protein